MGRIFSTIIYGLIQKEKFHNQYILKQDYIKKTLPQNILNEILDIRVFVLDKALCRVIDFVTQFCEQNKKNVIKAIKEYEIYYKNIVGNINFHDCKIK
ncbi:hypothetical protein CLAUR_016800 [Clostridium felsineum]|nr:hypothetical protein CLAUR_016800 [Clostridium felsineum]